MADLLTAISSSLLHQSPSATSPDLLLRLALTLLLSPLLLLSLRPHHKRSPGPPPHSYLVPTTTTTTQSAARALTDVLSLVSRVPVSSRKYELVHSLADRLLDDNLRFACATLNRAALAAAFARTISRLRGGHTGSLADRSMEMVGPR